jgi:hypothetical protein
MAHSPSNCIQVSPITSTYGMSSRIVNKRGCTLNAWTHFCLPWQSQGTPPCAKRVLSFPLERFLKSSIPFLSHCHCLSMAEWGLLWKGRVSCPCPSQFPFKGTLAYCSLTWVRGWHVLTSLQCLYVCYPLEQMAWCYWQTISVYMWVKECSIHHQNNCRS